MINNISETDINRLTSGQVIIDLKSIVKELVENSIDANCKKVEIIFQNYGVDSISVVDDGDGIHSDDFQSVCLRSHTSKLVKFNDLDSLQSLGFRGEALNSICSVSQRVKITTSTKGEYPKVQEIEYDTMGKMVKRQKKVGGLSGNGTSITIENLFSNLPVRHKNFVKNSKKEFHKAINFLISYLIIYPKIKFSVFNTTNKKNVVLNSPGGLKSTILDNMLTIFGTNGSRGLSPIYLDINEDLKVEGYMSNHSFGLGRSVQDRQYLFVNKRPILQKRLQKIVNESFRQFNHLQFPVFILNLQANPNILDVNMTPDKTMIAMHNEVELFETIRSKLLAYLEAQDSIVPRNKNQKNSLDEDDFSRTNIPSLRKDSKFKIEIPSDVQLENDDMHRRSPRSSLIINPAIDAGNHVSSARNELFTEDSPEGSDSDDQIEKEQTKSSGTFIRHIEKAESSDIASTEISRYEKSITLQHHLQNPPSHESSKSAHLKDLKALPQSSIKSSGVVEQSSPQGSTSFSETEKENSEIQFISDSYRNVPKEATDQSDMYGKNFHPATHEESMAITIGDQKYYERPSKKQKTRVSVHNVECSIRTDNWNHPVAALHSNLIENHKSKITIDNIDASKEQEEKLSYIISKHDFSKMKLIGQFNLGFILVSLNDHNLFIIDQHASDEKYNFERLNRDFQIKYQRLIAPKKVELSIIDEMLVIENQEIFQNNGFIFEVDYENQKPGSRINLVSLPISKDKIFNVSDFHELINLITLNSSNRHVKCSKIRSILAMRACRSSIMIGQNLSKGRMNEVVKNLTDLDKPWNCPHGRPTLRHLIELNDWKENLPDYMLV